MIKNKQKLSFPTPFELVIWITIFCFFLVVFLSKTSGHTILERINASINYWQLGFFSLLGFTLQMMMILVFGYALAVFKPMHDFLNRIAQIPKNNLQAVLSTGSITMLAGLLNWGFGLIIGALLARFISVALEEKGEKANFSLIASAGYLGMAVWHGGLSGSAPLKVAEPDNFLVTITGVIPIEDTIFSFFNLLITGGLILVFLLVLVFCEKYVSWPNQKINPDPFLPISGSKSLKFGGIIGLGILLILGINYFSGTILENSSIDLNFVNFALFGLTLFVYKSISKFTAAVTSGLKTSVDIFIQFPFYAGILGLLTKSGLLIEFSNHLVSFSDQQSIPVISFFSAAIINTLIPSGGGQWAVQGPVLMEAGKVLQVPFEKLVMAFSYGDQITNLLQPFWALPLLAITGVKPKNMFKYCFILCLSGLVYLSLAIYFFL
ncbi:TIGR00366 family protein [Algoriphagus sp.]|uniref:TIGR00366 family protein n=1 Tax=Algoriphagus sp. TaxID=1872435 RepID=UPI0025E3BFEE|nr:TIGR00366 family protein [Algoriphagus sp.]